MCGEALDVRLAYHEAGHAVIGFVLGYDVGKATICKQSLLGSVEVSSKRYSSAEDDFDDSDDICIDLAGPLAEQLVSRIPFEELICHGACGDWQSARKTAGRINRQYADRLIDMLMEETRALVEHYKEAIARVAAALLEHETLTGDEIKRLLEVVSCC